MLCQFAVCRLRYNSFLEPFLSLPSRPWKYCAYVCSGTLLIAYCSAVVFFFFCFLPCSWFLLPVGWQTQGIDVQVTEWCCHLSRISVEILYSNLIQVFLCGSFHKRNKTTVQGFNSNASMFTSVLGPKVCGISQYSLTGTDILLYIKVVFCGTCLGYVADPSRLRIQTFELLINQREREREVYINV